MININDSNVEQLRSDLLFHYYSSDIFDKKVINSIMKQYGVSRKYIMKMIEEFNQIELKLNGGHND